MAVLTLALAAIQVHSRHHHHHLLALDVRPPPTTLPVTTTSSTTSTTISVTATTRPTPPTTRTAAVADMSLFAAWTKVAICEESGWLAGPASYGYPDSLGITRANWFQFGGGSDLSPAAQIAVAMRLIAYYHASIPDQHSCQPGGW